MEQFRKILRPSEIVIFFFHEHMLMIVMLSWTYGKIVTALVRLHLLWGRACHKKTRDHQNSVKISILKIAINVSSLGIFSGISESG